MEKVILLMSTGHKWHMKPIRGICLMAIMMLSFSSLQAQTVKGKVSDENGAGMPGVNVLLKGTSNGTVSDVEGNYTVSVPEDAAQKILIYSFIGYGTQEVTIDGRTSIDIKMAVDATQLGEVVVVGYGTAKKSDITGAMGQLSNEAIRDVPVANITQALQGRVAGVDIQTTSPRPGGAPLIRIRGSRSLTSDANDPLIVVDGIPFNGSINDINQNDIVSMDILKDASATAIYGSRGSNGVILITTRSGRKGKSTISYDGNYGVNSAVGQYKLYDGPQFDAFRKAAVSNGAAYAPTTDEIANLAAGKQTDWQKEMYKTGYYTSHSLNVSGGSDDTQYSVSGGYLKQSNEMPGQDFTRYSLSTRIDQKIGERFKVGVSSQNSVNVTNGENANPMFALLTLSPLYNAYNPDGSIYNLPATGSIDATTRNPLLLRNEGSWTQNRKRLRTFNSLYGEVKITEGLKYRVNVGLDYYTDTYGQYYGSETPFQNGGANSAQTQNATSSSYTVENLLTYEKIFAEKHKLNFTGLYSFQQVETYSSQVSAQDLPADFVQYYNLGLANSQTINDLGANGYQKYGLISFMGRVNYSFSDRFIATVTARRDGSSRLAAGHQYYNYPAAALAWNVSKESFMSGIRAVSNMKLRLGAGQTSNQAIAPYSSLGRLGKVPYNFGSAGVFGYGVTSLPNTNLSWEFTTTYNIGLDFGLFNNRLTGSVEFYKSFTDGILQPRALPATSGVSTVTQNIGKSENKGVEVTLSGTIIDGKTPGAFTWSADLNWFVNRSVITDLGSGVSIDANNGWYVGYPVDAIFDYKKIGIWQTGDATEATAQGGFKPGNIRVADISGPAGVPDGKIDANDRTIIGSLQPSWQGGMTNRFSYKGFDLSVVLFGRVGGTLVSSLYQAYQSNPFNTLEGRRNGPLVDYWTTTNPTNAYPAPGQAQQPNFGSTLGYFDATYMKIRSINFGYTFPSTMLGKTGISSLRLYVTAQNPFTAFFSPYVDAGGVDPEATTYNSQNTGSANSNTPGWNNRPIVAPNTPPVKQFLFGISIKY
jgi:TonB-dependent starch-binding outer membrane protein SusC